MGEIKIFGETSIEEYKSSRKIMLQVDDYGEKVRIGKSLHKKAERSLTPPFI